MVSKNHFLGSFILLIIIHNFLYSQSVNLKSVPLVTTYTSEEHNGGMQNWSLVQSAEGIIYIGNNTGLIEFDGNHWRLSQVTNGTKVRSITIGTDGKIYVGAQGEFGYFDIDGQGELQYTSLSSQIEGDYPFDETWSVFTVDSTVYFCTFRYIFKFENDKIEIIDPGQPLGFSFMIQNKIFTHIPGIGLTTLDQKIFNLLPNGEFFANLSIRSMLPISHNRFIVVTHSQGLFVYEQGNIEKWEIEDNDLLSNGLINCAIILENGNFAFGTQNEGLVIIEPSGKLSIKVSEESGLGDRTVNHLFEDQQGNIWASLHDGISLIELGLPFGLLGDNLGISGSGYAATNYENKIFIGTNNHVYYWEDKGNWHGFQRIEGTQGQSYSLQVHDDQLLLSHHNGTFSIRDLVPFRIAEIDGTWMLLKPKNNPDKLIAGHYNGLFLLEKDNAGAWKFSKRYDGFSESSRVLANDKTGNIWMSHGYKGAYKIQFDKTYQQIEKIEYYNQDDGFPSNNLINVFDINDQLVFAAETGIYQFIPDKNRFDLHPTLNKYFAADTHIREMEQDAMGNIYYMANEEAGVLKKNQLGGYEKVSSIFNRILPYLNDALEKIKIIDHNIVLFSAKNGFITFDPTYRYQLPKSSPVLIRKFEITSDSSQTISSSLAHMEHDSIFQLKYQQNSIMVNYSSPAFGKPNRTQYRVKLANFEEDWSSWTTATSKEYTNLSEGDYTFMVQSMNIYGQISEPATLSLTIAPPWYRSNLAYSMYFFSSLAILSAVVVMLERKHHKEKNKMKAEQKKALEKKDIKLVELSKQSNEEITRLRNEKLRAEIAHKNKELGSAAMQIISKNEFIGHLKQNLNSIAKKSNNKSLVKDFNKIMQDIEKNIASDNDWEQFEFHFDKVHGNFIDRLKHEFPDLTPQEMKLSAYLRMNLSTKEIAQLLNISIRGVEIARYRLRKRLNLDRKDSLSEFILKY